MIVDRLSAVNPPERGWIPKSPLSILSRARANRTTCVR
jgi:hypothetical protein